MDNQDEQKIILTDDVSSMREQVQKAIVDIITRGLADGSIPEEKAKMMAQLVLDKIPDNITLDLFMSVLPKLDDEYPEFSSVVMPIMEQVEVRNKAIMDKQITNLLSEGKIEDALNLTNQAIEQEKNLS